MHRHSRMCKLIGYSHTVWGSIDALMDQHELINSDAISDADESTMSSIEKSNRNSNEATYEN